MNCIKAIILASSGKKSYQTTKIGTLKDLLHKMKEAFDVKVSPIRLMGGLNLLQHHIVLRCRELEPIEFDGFLHILLWAVLSSGHLQLYKRHIIKLNL